MKLPRRRMYPRTARRRGDRKAALMTKRFLHHVMALAGPILIVAISGSCGFVLGVSVRGV